MPKSLISSTDLRRTQKSRLLGTSGSPAYPNGHRTVNIRDVNVYLPIAVHPTSKSFDLKLDGLLVSKIDLSDAVVAPSIVGSSDVKSCF